MNNETRTLYRIALRSPRLGRTWMRMFATAARRSPNLVYRQHADKELAFNEALRVLRPGGRLQFADIANGKPVPEEAVQNIDLWTA